MLKKKQQHERIVLGVGRPLIWACGYHSVSILIALDWHDGAAPPKFQGDDRIDRNACYRLVLERVEND